MPLLAFTGTVLASWLTKRFADPTVGDQLDRSIPPGSVCEFVGPNCAGKTMTIRTLLELIPPSGGEGTVVCGELRDPPGCPARMGALMEAPAGNPQLSCLESLRVLARLEQIGATVIDDLLESVAQGQLCQQRPGSVIAARRKSL